MREVSVKTLDVGLDVAHDGLRSGLRLLVTGLSQWVECGYAPARRMRTVAIDWEIVKSSRIGFVGQPATSSVFSTSTPFW